MSVSPKNLMSRFHDLKIWQRNHDNIFKKTRKASKGSNCTESSDDSMDGVMVLECTPENSPFRSREEIVLPSPPKTFDQLLEEKLEEDCGPVNIKPKPKKPFLKKGTGLKRYGIEPGRKLKFVSRNKNAVKEHTKGPKEAIFKSKHGVLKSAIPTVRECEIRNMLDRKNSPKTTLSNHKIDSAKNNKEHIPKSIMSSLRESKLKILGHKDELKSTGLIPRECRTNVRRNLAELHTLDLTPLKMPTLNVRVNAKWCKVDENEPKKSVHFADAGDFYFNRSSITGDSLSKIDANEPPKLDIQSTEPPKKVDDKPKPDQIVQYNDQSSYEKQLEKELMLFEMLEERAENSSFCSTNSSILQLLANTPTKIRVSCYPNKLVDQSTPLNNMTGIDPKSFLDADDSSFITSTLLRQIKTLLQNKRSTETIEEIIIDPNDDNEVIETKGATSMKEDDISEVVQPKVDDVLHGNITCVDVPKDENHNCDKNDMHGEVPVKFSDEETWSSPEMSDSSLNNSMTETTSTQSTESKETAEVAINTAHSLPIVKEQPLAIPCGGCAEEISKKLNELNKEIAAFRSDNNALREARKKLDEERNLFEQQMKKSRREFEDHKTEVLFELEEERKKLMKDRMVFEKYVKLNKTQPNRKDREEINNLKIEVANLKETLKLKETKNGTTQARLRSQIKILEKENTCLKEDVEKLTRENAKLLAASKVNMRPSDTKLIHEINKNLSKIAKEAFKSNSVYLEPVGGEKDRSSEKDKTKNSHSQKPKSSPDKKSRLEHLIKSPILTKEEQLQLQSVMRSPRKNRKKLDIRSEGSRETSLELDDAGFKSYSFANVEKDYEKVFGNMEATAMRMQDDSIADGKKSDRTETILEDGSKEIRHKNGKIKIISPDGNFTVMKYPNGDEKHTNLKEGFTRYLFSQSKSSYTNYANGTEVLEFPTGQVEKKFKDGRFEVIFPNGSVRAILPDKTEEINHPDGTYIKINTNGDKTIFLKNGQKEIHTADEMRRIYPDGSVKVMFKDGRQESRYPSGRIRIRDKDGNLILDTFAKDQPL